MPPKNKVGRPSKYRPEFCQLYIEKCKEGMLVEEFPAYVHEVFGIFLDDETIYSWCRKEGDYFIKEFSDAKKTGDAYSKRFWIMTMKKAAVQGTSGFPAGPFVFLLKNKFGWRDHIDVGGPQGGPMDVKVRRENWRDMMKDPKLALAAAQVARKLYGGDDTET